MLSKADIKKVLDYKRILDNYIEDFFNQYKNTLNEDLNFVKVKSINELETIVIAKNNKKQKCIKFPTEYLYTENWQELH